MTLPTTADVVVVGAGIVGLATARTLADRGARVCVVDKERRVAAHQSSRNSGVLHTGVYYAPGSAKARNCRAGYALMRTFAREHGIAHEICGKVIVATDEAELDRLDEIERRGRANGVTVERVDREALRSHEPHADGVAALWVPEAGIIDFPAVARTLATLLCEQGSSVALDCAVVAAERTADVWRVHTTRGPVQAAAVVNCAGVHNDRVTRLFGVDPPFRIVPFRGEYYALRPGASSLCRGLIYPVPDPAFPFLGVHLTRTVGGAVECGPNAVMALSREGYRWRDVSVTDTLDALAEPGFRRLAARHWRTGAYEVARSASRALFARSARRLVPSLRARDLVRAGAGVRAQALNPDGSLVDDFVFVEQPGAVHVCNAPSPAATSSLAIGARVADTVEALS